MSSMSSSSQSFSKSNSQKLDFYAEENEKVPIQTNEINEEEKNLIDGISTEMFKESSFPSPKTNKTGLFTTKIGNLKFVTSLNSQNPKK